MLISLTEDHIKRGKRWNSECCPGALAINEALGLTNPDGSMVPNGSTVGHCRLSIYKDGKEYRFDTPHELHDFIMHYDSDSPRDHLLVRPCEFELDWENRCEFIPPEEDDQ